MRLPAAGSTFCIAITTLASSPRQRSPSGSASPRGRPGTVFDWPFSKLSASTGIVVPAAPGPGSASAQTAEAPKMPMAMPASAIVNPAMDAARGRSPAKAADSGTTISLRFCSALAASPRSMSFRRNHRRRASGSASSAAARSRCSSGVIRPSVWRLMRSWRRGRSQDPSDPEGCWGMGSLRVGAIVAVVPPLYVVQGGVLPLLAHSKLKTCCHGGHVSPVATRLHLVGSSRATLTPRPLPPAVAPHIRPTIGGGY